MSLNVMNEIDIAFAEGELAWHGKIWCRDGQCLILHLSDEIARHLQYMSRGYEKPSFNIEVTLKAASADRYRYFPFFVQVSGNTESAELAEIRSGNESISLNLQKAVTKDGKFSISIEIEDAEPDVHEVHPQPSLGLDLVGIIVSASGFSIKQPDQCYKLARFSRYGGPRPIFVVGSGRCGTSVLTWALGQHPNVGALEETNWLPLTLMGALASYRMAAAPPRNAPLHYGITEQEFLHSIGEGIDALHLRSIDKSLRRSLYERLAGKAERFDPNFQLGRSVWAPKQRWIDGAPLNTSYMQVIAETFDTARFIGIVREPVETIRSFVYFGEVGGMKTTLEEAAKYWLFALRDILAAAVHLGPAKVMVIDYATMSSHPEQVLRDCFFFLEEPNFAGAAATFSTRHNSSKRSKDARDEIDCDNEHVRRCLQLYEIWKSGNEMTEHLDTRRDIADRQRDLVSRLIACVT